VQLGPLATGRNTVRVRAWDSYNNSAQTETYFEVASSSQLTIADLFNFPNPFKNETSFTFRHNQTGTVHAKVKVYTLAGRAVRTIETTSDGGSFVRIPWDGRDEDGDPMANGVYLYKVIVRTEDGRFTSEALGKLSIVR
jgi:flagellar hook assembly protein FlgD